MTEHEKLDAILDLLRGQNGEPGLLELHRDLVAVVDQLKGMCERHEQILYGKAADPGDQGLIGTVQSDHKIVKYLGGLVVFILSTIFVQGVRWVFSKFAGS